jgi:ABC-type arginine transport system permease subunit
MGAKSIALKINCLSVTLVVGFILAGGRHCNTLTVGCSEKRYGTIRGTPEKS